MGGAAADLGDEPQHAVAVQHRHLAGPQVVRHDQPRLLQARQATRAVSHQVPQHAALHVHHVAAALAQVLVLHGLEPRDDRRHPAPEHERREPALVADAVLHRPHQLGVVEDHAVHVDDLRLVLAQLGGDPVADPLEVAARHLERGMEPLHLALDVGFGDEPVAHDELLALDAHHGPEPDARRRGDSGQLHGRGPARAAARAPSGEAVPRRPAGAAIMARLRTCR